MSEIDTILILSRTKINSTHDCIGGISLKSYKNIRLMSADNNPYSNTIPFQIGEIWNIKYSPSQHIKLPHIEDVKVEEYEYSNRRIISSDLKTILVEDLKVPIWQGSINNIFNSKLKWTKGGLGYIENNSIPESSVGFWISDLPLHYIFQNSHWYSYDDNGKTKYIKYAGYQEPIESIVKHTVLRISLIRWKESRAENELPRCYLQLSGWY